MPCIDESPAARRAPSRWIAPVGLCALLGTLAGCTSTPGPASVPGASAPASVPAPSPVPAPGAPAAPPARPGAAAPAPEAKAPTAARPAPRSPRYVKLGPPATPRNAHELRLQFAQRLVAAHPDSSYTARAPERLLAIPVLEVELNADGSVRRIEVLRKPTTGNEATQLAIEAVQRAAPYGEVSRLPRPWKVVETFLFDDDLRFKPRTLD